MPVQPASQALAARPVQRLARHPQGDAGLIAEKIAWTADAGTAMWSVVAVDLWKTTPLMALLILAALQTLPKDCWEPVGLGASERNLAPARTVFAGFAAP